MKNNSVLVLGGAGFIGRHVVGRLVDQGRRVVVPARRRARARHLIMLPTVEVVEADIHDPAALEQLVRGQDAVINLVGILHGAAGTPYGPQFLQAHVELPRKVVAACRQQAVLRLLHMSALGADPAGPSMYLRSKGDGEQIVRAAQGLAVTIFRPSVVFGAGDRFLNLFAALAAWVPVLPVGGADVRFQPIWVEDVARAFVNALDTPATIGMAYELCGPRIYTLRELVSFAARASGHSRPVIGLPDGLARLQARAMRFVPGEPMLSLDNLDSMKTPSVASRQPYVAAPELGIHPAPLEPEAAMYLAGMHPRTRFNAMRMRAGR
jgi:NADH dehydrogenase